MGQFVDMCHAGRIVSRLATLVFTLVTFFLARFGYGGSPVTFGESKDMFLVGCITTSLYMIIVPATILTQFGFKECPLRAELLWTIAGSILYILTGSKTLEFHISKETNINTTFH